MHDLRMAVPGETVRIEDYALLGDLQTAALDQPRRLDRLVLLPALRLGRLLRGASRRARARALAARAGGEVRALDPPLPARHADPRVDLRDRRGDACARSSSCLRAARRRTSCGSSRAWTARCRCARSSRSASTTGRSCRGCGGSITPGSRSPARTRLCLRTPVEVHGEGMTTVSEFVLRAGERIPFMLTWFPSHEPLPDAIDAEVALAETEEYWLEWAARCTHGGDYHEEIHQSLLLLKALTYAPTGGIVAAPTTSLPEELGGVRNWDYRYCWLRDATLTLLAMLHAGYRDEALAWRQWLLRAVAGDPADVQIMYGIAGERRLEERELDWLPGFARLAACARRERCVGAAAARRLRRGRSTPSTRPASTVRRRTTTSGRSCCEAARMAGGRLAPAGRRHLGGARPVPALHPLEGDGVGRVRSGRPRPRGVRPRGAGRALARL